MWEQEGNFMFYVSTDEASTRTLLASQVSVSLTVQEIEKVWEGNHKDYVSTEKIPYFEGQKEYNLLSLSKKGLKGNLSAAQKH